MVNEGNEVGKIIEVQQPVRLLIDIRQPDQLTPTVQESERPSKELIEYLSKEIETITNNNSTFRSRASLSVYLGPFIILGSLIIALKDARITSTSSTWTWILAGFAAICYVGIGWMSGKIEDHGWKVCNRYRELIARLHENPKEPVKKEDLKVEYYTRAAYVAVYLLMLAIFISSITLVSKLQITNITPKAETQTTQSAPSNSQPNTEK